MGRNRIAILVGQADEDYQRRFIEGFLRRGFKIGFDVCIFSMYRKYQNTEGREEGESSIFSLMNPKRFDAVILLKDTIQIAGKAKEIEEWLHKRFKGEVLVIEQSSDFFPSICTDGYTGMRRAVEHLVKDHQYKDIAFLNGKKWHSHSVQRLQAFRDVLNENGLPVKESRIVHGDFWYTSGEMCVEQLIGKRGKLPDAVAVANDCMAIGLCNALTRRGYRVPEDVAVVSYDSTEEGRTSPSPLTSVQIPAEECGEYSADYMAAKLDDREPAPFNVEPKLIRGLSCGCKDCTDFMKDIRRKKWDTVISEEGYFSVNTTTSDDLMLQNNIFGYLSMVYSYAYQIPEAESFHLCLNDTWQNMDTEPDVLFDANGYSDRMLHAIRYYRHGRDGKVSLSDLFPTGDMLPDLMEESDKPRAFFFTPVYAESKCFGYAVVSYGDEPRSYDEVYRLWIRSATRHLETLRRITLQRHMQEKNEEERVWRVIGSAEGPEVILTEEEKQELELVENILDENRFEYCFQPIVQVSTGEIYSYEALMRATTGHRISPLKIIKYAGMLNRLPDVECATFSNVLGILDADPSQFEGRKIFVNSIPGIRLRDEDSEKVTDLLKKYKGTVVVELTEEAELQEEDLKRLQEQIREMGFETAVDDYGTGYSNVSNLLRYMPNYVKIDRSLLSEIQFQPQKQHFVREIIEFCHENKIMALAEGVETTEELRAVIHLGADLIQGYYTAKPSVDILPEVEDKIRKEMRDYYQEAQDGVTKRVYTTGKTNRVLLSNLKKYGATDIVVPADNVVYKDVAIIGTPGLETDIHMRIESGYQGRITLENVSFSNVKERPCIELGDKCEVTLILKGENFLNHGGILVPKGATLTTAGNGNLQIQVYHTGYYGIGAGMEEEHGTLHFNQEGTIKIVCGGKIGVGIGAGKGGMIMVSKGRYDFETKGGTGVSMGAYEGSVMLVLVNCVINADLSLVNGVCLGCMNGDSDVIMRHSTFDFFMGATGCVGIGAMESGNVKVEMKDSIGTLNLRGEESTCVGALHGKTDIRMERGSLQIENVGTKALGIGGYTEDTDFFLDSGDIKEEIHNQIGVDTYVASERFRVVNGRSRFLINGEKLERKSEKGYSTDSSESNE